MKHTGLFSYFTRFDFIVNGEDIKLIEVNCDTPTGYLEPSVANERIMPLSRCKSSKSYRRAYCAGVGTN